MHVLFAEDVPPDQIQSDFISNLHFTYAGDTENLDDRRSITTPNLADLGKRLKKDQPEFKGSSDLFVGCMNVDVDDEEVCRVLAESKVFRKRHLVILAEENTSLMAWNSGAHQPRKVLVQKCDMIFSSNPKTSAWATSSAFEEEFGCNAKACVWGSDAHSESTLFHVAEERHCWIKADLSFTGLKQVTNEPSRVHLGALPPGTGNFDDRPWMRSLSIQRDRTGGLPTEKWFAPLTLPLTRDLVAIIGNKGSGKTALVDVLALLGNSQVPSSYFGFLNAKRFKNDELGKNRAADFTASLQWNSGSTVQSCLKETSRSDAPELVTYLPQGYLEHICSDAGEEPAAEFEREIERVIFSHVTEANRLGKESLNALIDYRTAEIKQAMSALKAQIRDCNRKYCDLLGKQSPETLSVLNQQIANREQEIAHLEQQKPTEVKPPLPPPNGQEDPRLEELASLRRGAEKQDLALKKVQLEKKSVIARLAIIEKLLTAFASFESQHKAFIATIRDDMATVGLHLEDCVSLNLTTLPLEGARTVMNERAGAIEIELDENRAEGLSGTRKGLAKEIVKIESQLQGPQRAYEAYTKAMNEWAEKKKSLIGAADAVGSLEYLKGQKAYLANTLQIEISALRAERLAKMKELHNSLRRQADICAEYYRPIDGFIKSSNLVQGSFQLEFRVRLDSATLEDRFFEVVSQSGGGTFYGAEDGRRRFKDIVAAQGFESPEDAKSTLETIADALQCDRREGNAAKKVAIDKQLRKGKSRKDLYDLLFSLDYLHPKYELRLDGRRLSELSPGERGLLLLVFYLLIDRKQCPLLLDQPEENLDNQSIKKILVPCIREAKLRRQIVMVTHNPNLAVVCDAEQVVVAAIDKADGNRIEYVAGSIEHVRTNQQLLDILEGTKPAFENRRRKYRSVGSLT